MSENEDQTWKLQCSFKGPKGTLINVRGSDGDDLDFNLKVLRTMIGDILEIEAELSPSQQMPPALAAVGATWTQQPQQGYQQPAPPSFVPQQAQPNQGPANLPNCQHGIPAKYVPGGMSKTGRPYRAFLACSMPREQQCSFRQDA